MALNKNRIDLKAIQRDQKAIDSLPNRGRIDMDKITAKHKALKSKMGKKK